MPDDHTPSEPPERPDDSPEAVRDRIRERTIARWEECEAARKAALDAGKSEDEAHDAAKAIWNGWAERVLAEKEELVEGGKWAVGRGETVLGLLGEVGTNDETRNWLETAATSFHSLRLRSTSGGGQPEGDSDNEQATTFSTLLCVGATIRFDGFLFPGHADFDSATFSGVAWFESATFSGDAGFDSATFSGDAGFDSATFSDHAQFHSATFGGHAQFYSATFSGHAGFDSATFSGVAWFASATFSGHAGFGRATFSGHAQFDSATFSGIAWFESATFSSAAQFDRATFSGDAQFGLASFEGNTSFNGAEFAGEAAFGAIEASRAFNLADARFETRVPDFIQAHFKEAPRLDNVSVPIPASRPNRDQIDKNDPARYWTLTRLAVQANDHDREHYFFKGQMRAERHLKLHGRAWRLFNRLYDHISDFGRSALRPLFWLGVTTALFAIAYGAISWSFANHGTITACTRIIEKSLFLALANALPAISGAQRQSILNAYSCLYGDPEKIPVAVGYLGVFQTLLSVIFLFLIALALRNMFRIK